MNRVDLPQYIEANMTGMGGTMCQLNLCRSECPEYGYVTDSKTIQDRHDRHILLKNRQYLCKTICQKFRALNVG